MEEQETKNNSKKKIMIIIIVIVLLLIGVIAFSAIIYLRGNEENKDDNIKYLINEYGAVNVNLISQKKDKKTYRVCSQKAPFCTIVNYNKKKKKFYYPKGEGFTHTITFMNQAISVLEKNGLEFHTYIDSSTAHDTPNNFILVIKKDNESVLTDTILEINNLDTINLLCPSNTDEKCTGQFEINIFNSEDYDLITKKYSNHYGIDSYVTLYEYLLKLDDAPYAAKKGKNIERHNIGYDMFSCRDEYCSKCKHIAYRYVIGKHNYVGNTIIVEGIN